MNRLVDSQGTYEGSLWDKWLCLPKRVKETILQDCTYSEWCVRVCVIAPMYISITWCDQISNKQVEGSVTLDARVTEVERSLESSNVMMRRGATNLLDGAIAQSGLVVWPSPRTSCRKQVVWALHLILGLKAKKPHYRFPKVTFEWKRQWTCNSGSRVFSV